MKNKMAKQNQTKREAKNEMAKKERGNIRKLKKVKENEGF